MLVNGTATSSYVGSSTIRASGRGGHRGGTPCVSVSGNGLALRSSDCRWEMGGHTVYASLRVRGYHRKNVMQSGFARRGARKCFRGMLDENGNVPSEMLQQSPVNVTFAYDSLFSRLPRLVIQRPFPLKGASRRQACPQPSSATVGSCRRCRTPCRSTPRCLVSRYCRTAEAGWTASSPTNSAKVSNMSSFQAAWQL